MDKPRFRPLPGKHQAEKVSQRAPSSPKLWVSAALGDIVHQECDDQHEDGSGSSRYDCVEIAKIMNLLAPDDGNQCCCPSWRMKGLCEMHDCYCRGNGNRGRKPHLVAKKLIGGYSDHGRKQMAAYEVARLSQRTLHGPVNKNGRCAKRPNDHDQIGLPKKTVMNICNNGDAQESADPGPNHFRKTDRRRALSHALHFVEVVHKQSPWPGGGQVATGSVSG